MTGNFFGCEIFDISKSNSGEMRSTSRIPIFFLAFLAVSAFEVRAVDIHGNNNQSVVIGGGAINTAVGGGKAVMNVASLKGQKSMGSNSQTIVVSGAVVNLAAAGAKSTLDIGGAGGGGQQVIAVDGSVLSTGRGSRSNSSLKIGR